MTGVIERLQLVPVKPEPGADEEMRDHGPRPETEQDERALPEPRDHRDGEEIGKDLEDS